MTQSLESLTGALSLWKEVNLVNNNSPIPDVNITQFISSIFNLGEFYYYIVDFSSEGLFIHVSKSVEDILGTHRENLLKKIGTKTRWN